MEHYDGLFGNYLTKTFSDIWSDYNSFKKSYDECGLTDALLTDNNLKKIYFILTAEYKNSHISNSDETQFTDKFISRVWQYGPLWLKKLEYQENIRNLTTSELQEGSRNIYNHSFNPSTEPSTQDTNELPTVDDQNVSKFNKSKIEAYMQAFSFLDADFTKEFVDKFKKLFIKIAEPNEGLWYGEV